MSPPENRFTRICAMQKGVEVERQQRRSAWERARAVTFPRFTRHKYTLPQLLVFSGANLGKVGIIGEIAVVSLAVTLTPIAAHERLSLWTTRGQPAVVEPV